MRFSSVKLAYELGYECARANLVLQKRAQVEALAQVGSNYASNYVKKNWLKWLAAGSAKFGDKYKVMRYAGDLGKTVKTYQSRVKTYKEWKKNVENIRKDLKDQKLRQNVGGNRFVTATGDRRSGAATGLTITGKWLPTVGKHLLTKVPEAYSKAIGAALIPVGMALKWGGGFAQNKANERWANAQADLAAHGIDPSKPFGSFKK